MQKCLNFNETGQILLLRFVGHSSVGHSSLGLRIGEDASAVHKHINLTRTELTFISRGNTCLIDSFFLSDLCL